MKKIFLIILLTFLLFPLASLAGVLPLVRCGWGEGSRYPLPCTLCDLFGMFNRIINFLLFYIVPPLAALMIAIGGFMMILAYVGHAGEEMINRAKALFKAVIIGLIIVYGAWLIIEAFFAVIGVKPIFRDWNVIMGC